MAKPIFQICNISIKYLVFPSSCKIAKLKPLFTKVSKTAPNLIASFSLLPLVSKTIEKVIHGQTQSFPDKIILFTDVNQFLGFYSTDSCLSYLNNKTAAGFESGVYTGMISIDILKVFDTVNHEILIKFIGFSEERQNGLNLICQIGNSNFILKILSQSLETYHAGCILGPLLFLL